MVQVNKLLYAGKAKMTEGNRHFLLIDASGFAYRAFHAFPARYRGSDGHPTAATLGYTSMIFNLLGDAQKDPPSHAAAVFDAGGKTFRNKIYPAYKSNRPMAPKLELAPQFRDMKRASEILGIRPIEKRGFEADDIIATMCDMAERDGYRITVVSCDKDYMQFVKDGSITLVDPMKGVRIHEKDVLKKFGCEPPFVPHVQALLGDAVDNIPGVPGCGVKTARAIISKFTTVQNAIRNWKGIPFPGPRAYIRDHPDEVIMYLNLATMRRDVPISISLDDFSLSQISRAELEEFMKQLEAAEWYEEAMGIKSAFSRTVDPVTDPYDWWREELAAPGQKVPSYPQCGYYQTRLVRNGPWVPVVVWRDPEIEFLTQKRTGKERLKCSINGKLYDPLSKWMQGNWMHHPISKGEYDYMIAKNNYAKKYGDCDTMPRCNEPIDFEKIPNPTFGNKRKK